MEEWEKERKKEEDKKSEEDMEVKKKKKKMEPHVLYQKTGKIRFISGVTMNTRSANCSLGGLSI